MNNKLYTYFPNYMVSGAIFSKMSQAPWNAIQSTGLQMDIAYLASWSGSKSASSFVDQMSTNGIADSTSIATMLWALYGDSWTKLWDAFHLQYKPLDNYNITETINRTVSDDRTIERSIDTSDDVTSTTTASGTSDITTKDTTSSETDTTSTTDTTDKETSTITYGKVDTVSSETDAFTYGFNSQEKVPTSVTTESSTDTQSGSDTTERDDAVNSATESKTVLSSTVDGTENIDTSSNEKVVTNDTTTTTDDTTDKRSETEDISRTRSGTVGQYSYQELLRQEFELWKNNFFQMVFEDCDAFLTLSIYNPCSE